MPSQLLSHRRLLFHALHIKTLPLLDCDCSACIGSLPSSAAHLVWFVVRLRTLLKPRDLFRLQTFQAKTAWLCVRRLLERQKLDNGNAWPETIAVVLWGTDNIKTYGESLAQVCKLQLWR